MELTDEQKEALEAVQAQFDPKSFADALNEGADSYFREVWQRGHSTATGQKKDTIAEKEKEIERLQEELSSRESEIKELQENEPDIDSLRKKWEENELKPYKEQAEKWRDQYRSSEVSRKLSSLKQAVASKVADEHEYVAELHVEKKMNGRTQMDEDGNTYFLDEQGERYYVPDGQDLVEYVASDVVKSLPERYRKDKAQGTQHSSDERDRSIKGQDKVPEVTRQQLNSDPQKFADFIGQFDSRQEGIEAFQNLPESSDN